MYKKFVTKYDTFPQCCHVNGCLKNNDLKSAFVMNHESKV